MPVTVTVLHPCREGRPGDVVEVDGPRARQLIAGGAARETPKVTRRRRRPATGSEPDGGDTPPSAG